MLSWTIHKKCDAYFSSAISGGYPDIAEKTFQEESFLYSSAFFTLRASLFWRICFVMTHLRWTTTAAWVTPGEPILAHLLRCDPLAVDDHSGMGHASHLHQPRLVNNPG